MTEKTTDVRSELVEDPSTSSGSIDDGARTDAPAAERGRRKVREGYVVSDKMDKTVVVAVEDRVKHRLYGKVLRQTSRLKAHDEQQQCRRWRPRPGHGDPAAERHQALAPGRDPREGQVVTPTCQRLWLL